VKCQKQEFSFNKRDAKVYCYAFLHVLKRDTCIKYEKNIIFFYSFMRAGRRRTRAGRRRTRASPTHKNALVRTLILSHAKISLSFVKNRLKITSATKEWQKSY
jgi:hypothetical protein